MNWINPVEVVHEDGGWVVTAHSGGQRILLRHFHTKTRATLWARGYCRGVATLQAPRVLELRIKDRKGVIREKDSYGRDPSGVKG